MLTLSHLLPQTPLGHAAHRVVTARLHTLLASITSTARVAELLLRAVLPQPRSGSGGPSGQTVAASLWRPAATSMASLGMAGRAADDGSCKHAAAQRLVSCVRSAYPAVEEIECFMSAPVVSLGDGEPRASQVSGRWRRLVGTLGDNMASEGGAHGGGVDGGALGPADARTAARDVLTHALVRRRNAAPTGKPAQRPRFLQVVARVAPSPLAALLKEDMENSEINSDGGRVPEEGAVQQREVRRAGSTQMLGLREGRLGPAETAQAQLQGDEPLAAMLPVLQAMLARCVSHDDLDFGQPQVRHMHSHRTAWYTPHASNPLLPSATTASALRLWSETTTSAACWKRAGSLLEEGFESAGAR